MKIEILLLKSQNFVLERGFNFLNLNYRGGEVVSENKSLRIDLIETATQKVLHSLDSTKGTHRANQYKIDINKWLGKTVHLKIVDENSNPAYAWIGLDSAILSID